MRANHALKSFFTISKMVFLAVNQCPRDVGLNRQKKYFVDIFAENGPLSPSPLFRERNRIRPRYIEEASIDMPI